MGITAVIIYKDFSYFFYIGILMIGSIFVPIIIAEFLYELVSRKITIKNNFLKFISEVTVLIILFIVAFIFWSIFDLIIDYSGFEGLTIENIKMDFRKEFKGYIPFSVFVAIIIPTLDRIIKKKINS